MVKVAVKIKSGEYQTIDLDNLNRIGKKHPKEKQWLIEIYLKGDGEKPSHVFNYKSYTAMQNCFNRLTALIEHGHFLE
jgi:hypothetical protein